MKCHSLLQQVFDKDIDKGGFAQAEITGNRYGGTRSLLCLIKRRAEHAEFELSPDERRYRPGRRPSRRPGRRLILGTANRRNEAVAGFGDGLDISMIAWLFIKCLAKRGYVAVQVTVFD